MPEPPDQHPILKLFQTPSDKQSTEQRPMEDELAWSHQEICSPLWIESQPTLISEELEGTQFQHSQWLDPLSTSPQVLVVFQTQPYRQQGPVQVTVDQVCLSSDKEAQFVLEISSVHREGQCRTRKWQKAVQSCWDKLQSKALAKAAQASAPLDLPPTAQELLHLIIVPDVGFPTCESSNSVAKIIRKLRKAVVKAEFDGALESTSFFVIQGSQAQVLLDRTTLEAAIRLDGKKYRLRTGEYDEFEPLIDGHLPVEQSENQPSESTSGWADLGGFEF